VIPQSYPLIATRYEVADTVDGKPIYRATTDQYAVIGWKETFGDKIDFVPVLIRLDELEGGPWVPDDGSVFEYETAQP